MLSLVQGMLPVVSVFFELGREAASVAVHGMRAFSIADILRHVRLHGPEQVIQCLDILSQTLRRVRGDDAAEFYVLDDQGHCLVAETTMRSILRLWQEIVAQRASRAKRGSCRPEPLYGRAGVGQFGRSSGSMTCGRSIWSFTARTPGMFSAATTSA